MTVVYKDINEMLIVYNKSKSYYKFIIDWSAKAGCTIICKMFFNYMDILEKALKHSSWIHNYRVECYYNLYGKVKNNNLLSDKFITINSVQGKDYFNVRYQIKPFMIWIWLSVLFITVGGIFSFLKKKI